MFSCSHNNKLTFANAVLSTVYFILLLPTAMPIQKIHNKQDNSRYL